MYIYIYIYICLLPPLKMYLFNFSLKSFIALYSVQFLSSPDFREIRSLNKYFRNGYDK